MLASSIGGRSNLSLRQCPEQRIHSLDRHAGREVGDVNLVVVGVSRVDANPVMPVDYAGLPQQTVIYARHRLHAHLSLVGSTRHRHLDAECPLLVLDFYLALGGVRDCDVCQFQIIFFGRYSCVRTGVSVLCLFLCLFLFAFSVTLFLQRGGVLAGISIKPSCKVHPSEESATS